MLVLFRCFLTFFLGLDASRAQRLTDLQAWGNPIAQVRVFAEGRMEDFPTQRHRGTEGKNLEKMAFNAKAQRRKGQFE